jgi:hypothetical protein
MYPGFECHELAIAHFGENYLQKPIESNEAAYMRIHGVWYEEQYNTPARTQPPYPPTEHELLEQWRSHVVGLIRARLASHQPVQFAKFLQGLKKFN